MIHFYIRRQLLHFGFFLLFVGGFYAVAGATPFAQKPIVSASEYDYPPFCVVNEQGEADGFSVELLRAVLETMGMEVSFKVDQWKVIKQELEDRKIEVLPLVGRTPEREEVFDFSIAYLTMHGAIFVREDESGVRTVEDLKDKAVLVMEGDNAQEYLLRQKIAAKVVAVASFKEAMLLLSQGKHDAVVVQRLMGLQLIKTLGISNLKVVGPPIHEFVQRFSFAVPEGEKELLSELNEGLAVVIANGTLEKLKQKWFGPLDQKEPPVRLYGVLLLSLAGAFLFSFWIARVWQRSLRVQVIEKTREIEKVKHLNQVVFDRAKDGILIVDLESKGILDANESAVARLGYSREELCEMTVADINGEANPKAAIRRIQHEARQHATSFITVHKAKSGKLIPVEIANSELMIEGRKSMISFARDLTDRMEAQQGLKNSEERFRTLTTLSPVGVFQADKDQNYTFVNNTWSEISGLGMEQAAGDGWVQGVFLDDRAKVLEEWKQAAQKDRPFKLEYRFLNPSGEITWVFGQSMAVKNADNEVTGYMGTVTDISEVKEREQELALAKEKAEFANQAKSDFLSMMSHELRTPMNGVLGVVQILMDEDLTEEQHNWCDIIFRSGQGLVTILNDILDLAKIESGVQELRNVPFSLVGATEAVYTLFSGAAEAKRLELVHEIDPKVKAMFLGDPELLTRVLTNLVGNAIKFTEKGTVGVKLKVVEDQGDVQVIRIQVYDTGIGIDPKFHQQIFDPFQQTEQVLNKSYRGTGLGLSIAQKSIEKMGGQIWVQSGINEGSRFEFDLSLPVVEQVWEGQSEPQKPGNIEVQQTKKFALLVEDDQVNQKVLRTLLQRHNLDVEIAGDGEKAVSMTLAKKYDLIFMDLIMPVLDGYQATENIRRPDNPNHETPILALTALVSTGNEQKCYDLGMQKYLTKPIDAKALAAAIREFT